MAHLCCRLGAFPVKGRRVGERRHSLSSWKGYAGAWFAFSPRQVRAYWKETTEYNCLCSQHAASLEHCTSQGRTMKHHKNWLLTGKISPPSFVITDIILRNSLHCTHLHLAPHWGSDRLNTSKIARTYFLPSLGSRVGFLGRGGGGRKDL